MIRIYTKPQGQIPDYSAPVILHTKEPNVGVFCDRIHRGLRQQFKHAIVWGASAKHQPQRVGKFFIYCISRLGLGSNYVLGIDHVLSDEDVVQIVKKIG